MLLIDGVKYHLHEFKEEREFESVVDEHAKDIFGEESVYFGKKKISSLSGIGSIPDGYAIAFQGTPCWYIVEVELSSHPIFEHIVPQIHKFINGIRSDQTKRELINYMNEEIRSQPIIEHLIKERFGEVYKFLSDLVYKPPIVLIIIDEKTKELDDVVSSIPAETKVLEFKTFEREGVGLGVHAHLFEPVFVPPLLREELTILVVRPGEFKEKGVIIEPKLESKLEQILERTTLKIKDNFFKVREKILKLGDDVEERLTNKMICYDSYSIKTGKKRLMACFELLGKRFVIHLRKGTYNDRKGKIKYGGWGGYPLLSLKEEEIDIDYLFDLLSQAYQK